MRITDGGVANALFIAVRIVSLLLISSVLTFTTSPTDLTDALERVMKPLKYLRVPVHEIAMMMTIALRFVPTLLEETDKIMSAQKARGADLESGCYHGGEGRTRMKVLRAGRRDFAAVALTVVCCGAVLFFSLRFPPVLR